MTVDLLTGKVDLSLDFSKFAIKVELGEVRIDTSLGYTIHFEAS